VCCVCVIIILLVISWCVIVWLNEFYFALLYSYLGVDTFSLAIPPLVMQLLQVAFLEHFQDRQTNPVPNIQTYIILLRQWWQLLYDSTLVRLRIDAIRPRATTTRRPVTITYSAYLMRAAALRPKSLIRSAWLRYYVIGTLMTFDKQSYRMAV